MNSSQPTTQSYTGCCGATSCVYLDSYSARLVDEEEVWRLMQDKPTYIHPNVACRFCLLVSGGLCLSL